MNYCPECGNKLGTKKIDDGNYLACDETGCGFVLWDNPVPVVAALVEYSDKYIIAHNTAWPPKIFSLITGYLEKSENPDEAVLREVQEELNLEASITSFIGHYIFSAKNQLILAYEVKAHGKVITNHEIDGLKYLTYKELVEYDFRPLTITESIIRDWKINKNK